MADVRLIKRYANRKLYDTCDKRYVTLEQIATLIRNGDEIKVVDNTKGVDLTSITLSHILVEQEKKREGGLPKNFLTELVKNSTTIFDYFRKSVTTWLQAAQVSEDAIERNVDDLVKKGQLSMDEARKLKDDIVSRTREYMARIDQTIDGKVQDFLAGLKIPTRREVDGLKERLESLQTRYDALIARTELREPTETSGS
jgi:polyhydroxyalkanoate synthesis repressor PhaR